MNEINKAYKDYIYTNDILIESLYSQNKARNKVKKSITFKFPFIEPKIEFEKNELSIYDKIDYVYKTLNDNKQITKPKEDLSYYQNRFCMENIFLTKIVLNCKNISDYYKNKTLNLWICPNRVLDSKYATYPLILLPNDIKSNFRSMHGSSGYSIFKLLTENYLKINGKIIANISNEIKKDFVEHPITFFEEIGGKVLYTEPFETLYLQREMLNNDEEIKIYTFAYPLYIARVIGN